MRKEYLGSNVDVLAIEGYGEPSEHPQNKALNASSKASTEEAAAQGRENSVAAAGVLYRGERRWRDLTGGGATLCCSQCCYILGYASNSVNDSEPTFRLYKHRLLSGSHLLSKNTCGTFISHQMVRYAESQAVFTFYIMRENSISHRKPGIRPTVNCLLLKMISWDTQIAAANPEEKMLGDSFTFQNAVKVVFQEKILSNEEDHQPLSPLLFWNNIDLCCPPMADGENTMSIGMNVDKKNSTDLKTQRSAASVKIFLSPDEWNELRQELISKRFPNSMAAVTVQFKRGIDNSSIEGYTDGLSFLSLN